MAITLVFYIKVVDLLAPCAKGGKIGLFGGEGNTMKLINYIALNYGGYSVFTGVEERTREENDFYHKMIERDVIKINPNTSSTAGSKAALVYGQMNEPTGACAHVALTGLTIAEYFHDEEGQDVLLFIDNIFRFTQARSEVSAPLGRVPSAAGYQLTLATDMGGLQECTFSTAKRSVTSVCVPPDDLTDPAAAITVLLRSIAELGMSSAVKPLDSTSRMLDTRIIGLKHYEIARATQKILQDY